MAPLRAEIAIARSAAGFVRITRWPGREVAGRLNRWQKFHTSPPLSAGCHPARCMALPAFHAQLPRCRGTACRARARYLLRERAQLGTEIRADDCTAAAAGSSSAERSMASRRDGHPDRGQTDVSMARRRSRRRDPRRLGSAPARPARCRQARTQPQRARRTGVHDSCRRARTRPCRAGKAVLI